jgi:hypothetical protein
MKTTGSRGLLHKYSGKFFSEGLKYIEKLKIKRVFKILIESISGKAKVERKYMATLCAGAGRDRKRNHVRTIGKL